MKVPSDANIPREKLTDYLLIPKEEDDKSKFLAQAGFTLKNPEDLEFALRELIASYEAEADRINAYGTFYQVKGHLKGINEYNLSVITIWLEETATGEFRLITLKPWREDDET